MHPSSWQATSKHAADQQWQGPTLPRMGQQQGAMLSLAGKMVLSAAAVVALAAAFWPSAPTHHHQQQKGDSRAEAGYPERHPPGFLASFIGTECPLGYTSGSAQPAARPLAPTPPSWSADTTPTQQASAPGTLATELFQLYYNATIWTGDDQVPLADAMLVKAGGIMAVGSLVDVLAAAGPAAAVSPNNMQGAFLMPGFVDGHVHLIPGGQSLTRVDLRGVPSIHQFEARVAAGAEDLGPQDWVLGGLWDEQGWGGQLPNRTWLDKAAGGRPVYLTRMDSHMGVASSAALRLANITGHTPDPEGGVIDRDALGEPTGVVRETAMQLVSRVIPEPSVEVRAAALAAASRYALSRGVTTVVDLGRYPFSDVDSPWRDLQEVYVPAADAGQLGIRVYAFVPLGSWRRMSAYVKAFGRGHPSGRLFWGGVKEFLDGSLGSRTALLWQPYRDAPPGHEDTRPTGQRMISTEKLAELVHGAMKAGLQPAVHAIGDRAVDEMIRVYQDALNAVAAAAVPPVTPKELARQLQPRIEHVQHTSGGANVTSAMARAGLVPVPNPLHLLTDRTMVLPRLGADRAAHDRNFAYGSMVAAGLQPPFSSDWPVVDLQPLISVYATAFRHAPPRAVACAASAGVPEHARMEMVGVAPGACLAAPVSCAASENDPWVGSSAACADGREETGASQSAATAAVATSEAEELTQAWGPTEQVSLEAALKGHTVWAAKAALLQDFVGALRPGLRADFIQLSDPLDAEDRFRSNIPAVVRTWVDGELAYDLHASARENHAQPER